MQSIVKKMLKFFILMLLSITAFPVYAVLDENTPVPSRLNKKAGSADGGSSLGGTWILQTGDHGMTGMMKIRSDRGGLVATLNVFAGNDSAEENCTMDRQGNNLNLLCKVVWTTAKSWSAENYMLKMSSGELSGQLISAGGRHDVSFLRPDELKRRKLEEKAAAENAARKRLAEEAERERQLLAKVPKCSSHEVEQVSQVNPRYVIKCGEVYDKETKLTWKRCSEGLSWQDGSGCVGTKLEYTFNNAQRLGQGGWRVPNKDELETLIDRIRNYSGQEPAIDIIAFPDINNKTVYWSSTSSNASHASNAWVVDFFDGSVYYYYAYPSGAISVRLVRGGQ